MCLMFFGRFGGVANYKMARKLMEVKTVIDQNYIGESDAKEFIVVTESGIIYEMQKRNPDKKLYTLYNGAVKHDCVNMKKNNLLNIYAALLEEQPELIMDEELRQKALVPIQRMLELS